MTANGLIDFKKQNNEKANKRTESKHKIANNHLDLYYLVFHYVTYNLIYMSAAIATLLYSTTISGIMDKRYFINIKILFPLLMFIWNEMDSAQATQGESKEYFTTIAANLAI